MEKDSSVGASCPYSSKPKFINEMNFRERKRFIDSFDTIFCDCDGVIWHTMQHCIPGAGNAIEYLRSCGKQIVFVTNNSIRPIQNQIEKFKMNGIIVEEEDVIHPVRMIIEYLKERNFDGLIYCCATKPFKDAMISAGFDITDGPNRCLDETFQDLASCIFDNQQIKAVVIDVDYNLSATKLMKCHLYLKNPNCLFIGGAADTLIPFGDNDIIGPGPFLQVVEKTTNKKAVILGKPGAELCNILKTRYQKGDSKRCIFVGDSLDSDIGFGKMCGFQTLSVLTGATKIEHLLAQGPTNEPLPDYYANSIADFVDFLK